MPLAPWPRPTLWHCGTSRLALAAGPRPNTCHGRQLCKERLAAGWMGGWVIPSGKLTVCYGKWVIDSVDLPMKQW